MSAARVRTSATRLEAVLPYLLAIAILTLGGCADLGLWPSFEAPTNPAAPVPADRSHYERGKRELAAGRLGLAVRHFQAALERAPKSVEALNGLGAAFDRLGRFDLSMRAYGRALAIDPRAAQTLNNLGYSYLLQGRYDLAVAYLRDASARAGADARIMDNRRLAEMTLAKAGGPAFRRDRASDGSAPGAPFKPHIRRAGKAIRHLVTKPPGVSGQGRAAAPARLGTGGAVDVAGDLLPAFLAAPMALEGTWVGAPALGAAGTLSAPATGAGM